MARKQNKIETARCELAKSQAAYEMLVHHPRASLTPNQLDKQRQACAEAFDAKQQAAARLSDALQSKPAAESAEVEVQS